MAKTNTTFEREFVAEGSRSLYILGCPAMDELERFNTFTLPMLKEIHCFDSKDILDYAALNVDAIQDKYVNYCVSCETGEFAKSLRETTARKEIQEFFTNRKLPLIPHITRAEAPFITYDESRGVFVFNIEAYRDTIRIYTESEKEQALLHKLKEVLSILSSINWEGSNPMEFIRFNGASYVLCSDITREGWKRLAANQK